MKDTLKWFVDKKSKIPLYLQLKDLVRYYISTGAIHAGQRLPTIKELSKRLAINFETIRKTYKELEKEGLIAPKRGSGTVVRSGLQLTNRPDSPAGLTLQPVASLKNLFLTMLQDGIAPEEIRIFVDQALHEVVVEDSTPLLIFTECNVSQVEEIGNLLRSYLNVQVESVLLKDLRKATESISRRGRELRGVITTGFHINEVRKALVGLAVKIDYLITNMSPESRRELATLEKTARYGFICRDQESIPFYKEMLRQELDLDSNIACCVLREEKEVERLLQSVDVLLVSPPVYDDIKHLAPPTLRIFNVFNRVDAMSLMVIKEKILGAGRGN